MRLKTTSLKLILLALVCFSFVSKGQAQIRIYTEGSYIKAELNEEEQDQVMESSTKILNKYAEYATFTDQDGVFSDDAYTEFLSIFSGNAEVYDDLAKKNQTNINYATYADNVYNYMQSGGVKFEITETYLDEITYDSSGFYVITVSFIKTMFNGLSESNEIVNFPNNGKNFDLKMRIEVPEYDLSDAAILGVEGESKKIKVESANLISVNGNYHLGNVSKTATTNISGYSDDMAVDYNSYGVDVVFRRSINGKKTLFLALGASAGFHNFSTDLSSYTGSLVDELNVDLGGIAFDEGTNSLGNGNLAATKSVLAVNGLREDLQVIDIQIPIGLSYKVFESYDWDIFVDVAVVPTYSIASSGNYSGGLQVQRIPDDRDLFPQVFIDAVTSGDGVFPYVLDDPYGEELVESESQFSASAQVTPMIHYKFNFNMSFEFGANLSYGFLPYFQNETNHLGTEQSNLLEITSLDSATNPAVLQNGFKNVGVLRYGLRAGIVFKL